MKIARCSRDWAAKAQQLLGVRAVLASSYEQIHRSNLIGMGILPLVVPEVARGRLGRLAPGDRVEVFAAPDTVAPRARPRVTVVGAGGESWSFDSTAAVETSLEVELLRAGGVIPLILGRTLTDAA